MELTEDTMNSIPLNGMKSTSVVADAAMPNFCSMVSLKLWLSTHMPLSSTLCGEEINVFRAPNGFIIALTYSSQSEWVKNVLAAGGCELKTRGKKYQLSAPQVVRDPTRRRFPVPVRLILKVVDADEYMELSRT